MMEMITDGGIVAILVGIVFGAFKLIEKIWPTKNEPVLQCPNKIEGLADNMKNVNRRLGKIEEASTETNNNVRHLTTQHAPESGIEQWKIPKRMIPLLEAAVKQGERTLETLERHHMEQKNQTTDMIRVLERIADRRSMPR